MYLIPAKDKIVRDPRTGVALPPGGADKPDTSYWHRRLRDGDVTRGKPPKPPKATKHAKPSKETD